MVASGGEIPEMWEWFWCCSEDGVVLEGIRVGLTRMLTGVVLRGMDWAKG